VLDEPLLIYTTCPDDATGEKLARLLVETCLAACVNLTPHLKSIYAWEGRVEEASEVGLSIKTRCSLKEKVCDLVMAHHPYKTPALWCMPMEAGSQATLEWLVQVTQDKDHEGLRH